MVSRLNDTCPEDCVADWLAERPCQIQQIIFVHHEHLPEKERGSLDIQAEEVCLPISAIGAYTLNWDKYTSGDRYM